MKYEVRPTRNAKRSIRETSAWYRAKTGSDEVADQWLDRITSALDSLSINPERCSLYVNSDDFDVEIREMLYGSGKRKTHRIFFTISENAVSVIAVKHFAQRDLTPGDV